MPRKSAAAVVQPDLLDDTTKSGKPKLATKEQIETVTKAKPKAVDVAKPAENKGHLTIVKNTPANTLSVLVEAMSRKDAQNLQIVANLHKEMIAEQARLDYIAAMRDLKRELPVINKDGKIEFKDKGQGKATLRFASFENIHEVITPLLDKHGFDLWFSSEPGAAGMINVIGNIEHLNGYVRRTVLPMPHDASGGKSGAQGWASAFSFGKRIVTIGLLNIRTRAPEDRDLDGNKPKVTKSGKPMTSGGEVLVEAEVIEGSSVVLISTKQHDELVEAIENCGATRKQFCASWQIEKVADLAAEHFERAMKACRDRAAKHQ